MRFLIEGRNVNPIEKQHVYSLLCAAVLADNRILDIEKQTFVKVATGIQIATGSPDLDSPHLLHLWFDDNYLRIAESLLIENWQINIAEHLQCLQHVSYKWHVLQAMISIAISDGEFHNSEVDILKFAVDYWQENRADYFEDEGHGVLEKSTRSDPSNLDMFASRPLAVGE